MLMAVEGHLLIRKHAVETAYPIMFLVVHHSTTYI